MLDHEKMVERREMPDQREAGTAMSETREEIDLVNAAEITAVCDVTEVVDGGRQAENCMAMAERGGCSALGTSVQSDLSQPSIAALKMCS